MPESEGDIHVSIVIPTYNRAEQLRPLLERCLAQSYPAERTEVLVVDDGSSDGTAAMLAELASGGRLVALQQANAGPGPARNLGVQAARGEIVIFLDDDLVPSHDLVADHVQALHEHPGQMSQGIVFPAHDTSQVDRLVWEGRFAAGIPYFACTANLAVRRELLLAVGGFDPSYRYSEGTEMAYRILKRFGTTVRLNRRPFAHHRKAMNLRGYAEEHWNYGRTFVRLLRAHPGMLHPHYAGPVAEPLRLALAAIAQFNFPPDLPERVARARSLEASFAERPADAQLQAQLLRAYRHVLDYAQQEGGYQELHGIAATSSSVSRL